MFKPDDPTALPDYQIDPLKSPFFQILQPLSEQWVEVGFVWTSGTSRTSSTENWYLYSSVTPGTSVARGAYMWPGYDASGRIIGAAIRLVPATPPAGATTDTLKDYLERSNGVTLTYIKGTMAAG